jgi:hypothetical protein
MLLYKLYINQSTSESAVYWAILFQFCTVYDVMNNTESGLHYLLFKALQLNKHTETI